ncbi:MAG: DUF3566 domain-containing protein [Bifidobacteriaceae bacterium]|nr:DUF3566 domain-containing protein [Bifidobacteriaceae bacterium]
MSSQIDSAPDLKPAADEGAAAPDGGVERKPAQAKSPARSGHAVEPPPSIRPKAKPKSSVGSSGPVRRVGHSEGESGPSHTKAAASGSGAKRSYRTTRSAPVVVGESSPRRTAGGKAGRTAGGKAGRAASSTSIAGPGGSAVPIGGPATGLGAASSAAPMTTVSPTNAAGGVAGAAGGAVDPGTLTQVVAAAAGIEAAGTATTASVKGRKRVKLNLSYVAPLSVMKISFLVSVAMGIAFVVAIYILWNVLNDRAIFDQIDQMITDVVGQNRPESLDVLQYVEQGRIMSGAAIIAVIDVVVFTAVSTLVAVIYNIIAALVGGIKVTLKDR